MGTPLQTNLIHELFDQAVQLPAEQREAFLLAVCKQDEQARADVRSLLAAHDRAGEFFGAPNIAALIPSTEFPAGTRIGRYTILQMIGEGGYGVVYLAEQDRPLQRRVAIKVIKAGMDTRQVIARFDREREALAMMEHPNIAKVFDAGATESGRPYFVMEWVDGKPITDFCRQFQLELHERLRLFMTVCSAVQHAHGRGILHRDLKPANILVTIRDGLPVVKVIDFGIAKALFADDPAEARTTITIGPQLVGTPQYMSPEQAKTPPENVDSRTDVYSLGVLLYELLTDSQPVDAERLRSAAYQEIHRILNEIEPIVPSVRLTALSQNLAGKSLENAQSVRKLSRQVRGDLDWIVMKALEKDPARRFQSADGLSADIARYLADQPVIARPPSAAYRIQKFVRRRRGMLRAIAVVLLMLEVVVIAFMRSTPPNIYIVAPPASSSVVASEPATTLEPGLVARVYVGRFEKFAKLRVDPRIDFVWSKVGSPDDVIASQQYSVRWTGILRAPSGDVWLAIHADDGVRLIVDGETMIAFEKPQIKTTTHPIIAGDHEITIEYWNRMGPGRAALLWLLPDGSPDYQVVPASALFHMEKNNEQQ